VGEAKTSIAVWQQTVTTDLHSIRIHPTFVDNAVDGLLGYYHHGHYDKKLGNISIVQKFQFKPMVVKLNLAEIIKIEWFFTQI
jgi:hypothetical protein